ncbi:AraC family transcriptional regulator [Aerococcus kribbianus]|uniref:Helix-turn-helix domain-containing protein n=1 Tax=Aerococcus kribbianus TaxID=2999064 RepID=A0A9X3FMS0_9LACT|nr:MULTISPECIES: helix-turn-helix domain-containing protein [unclassified Aerococcus]MCZ0717265.1 helix-turn-helix domain-containing protein [Aerococcus sp. YH-aer221]MCZ0725553.1 helix-turn-helix domain-containing protein [Aerococcus sp. YH-aer222]
MEVAKLYTQQNFFSLNYHDERHQELKSSFNGVPHFGINTTEYADATALWHEHDHLELFVYMGNLCHYKIDQREYAVYKGDILLIPPYTPHQLNSEKGINNSRYVAMVPENILQQFTEVNPSKAKVFKKFLSEPGHFRLEAESIDSVTDELSKIMTYSDDKATDVSFITAYHLLRAMTTIFQSHKLPYISGNYQDDRHFSHIIYFIDQHFRESDLQLQRITEEFGISPYYFSKLFRKEMNLNFHEYLVKKRAHYAARLMREIPKNKMSLQEVSDDSGFGDYSTFYRSFKKVYNESPKNYIKNHTNEDLMV